MKTLARFGIRGTVALNSDVCNAAPDVIEEALNLGWELMGHGQTNTHQLNETSSIEEEREIIGKPSSGSNVLVVRRHEAG